MQHSRDRRVPFRLLSGVALMTLGACSDGPFDVDMRDLGNVFDTSDAVMALPDRPRPDNRGVISYPNYQVVVAQRGDTPTAIAGRLGFDAGELATYNGIAPDTVLRRDEILALPRRVSEPSPATGSPTTGPIRPVSDLTAAASAAIDRAEVTTTPLAPASTAPVSSAPAPMAPATPAPVATPAPAPVAAPAPAAPAAQSGEEPIRHQVARGETAYSIARRYNVPVETIREWNGLGGDLALRAGQFLLIPQAAAQPVETATPQPGQGSATPAPPSAAEPLPEDEPQPAATAAPAPPPETPDLGAQQTAPADDARLLMPVSGSIIRAYAPGRNEGIDIGAAAGTEVRAADAGTVAAVTTNTDGIQIVVIRHAGDLLTVYTHLDGLSVERGASVSRGQTIGRVRAGSPSFLHFEVRRGMDSADPTEFLP